MREEKIMKRLQEHYDYLVAAGYEVVFTALQGSQNYLLDEYSENYQSDIDSKSIVLPSLDDFVKAKQPISAVEIMDNEEHAEVKDIRVMFEMFKKENISYIELLYSNYIIFNPKYKEMIKLLFDRRDDIVAANFEQFLNCIAGMAYEKDKALCHPYPGIIDKINKYGYDGKQLSHCARLLVFMNDVAAGRPIKDCYVPPLLFMSTLMNYKKQLDENGDPLPVEEAVRRSKIYVEEIKELKESLLDDYDFKIDTEVYEFLDELKAKILKYRIKQEVCLDLSAMLADMIYPDEEFKKAEAAAIGRMKVEPKNNIYDYYN